MSNRNQPTCKRHEPKRVESPATCRHCLKEIEPVEFPKCSGCGVTEDTMDDCPKCNGSGISSWRRPKL